MNLSFEVKQPLSVVFRYLSDMQQYASVHPVIHRISKSGDHHYVIHETLKVCGIPCSFTYPATVECRPLEHRVIMNATVRKLAHIEIAFVLRRQNGVTCVDERIALKSPLPVMRAILRVFKRQHEQLFRNIEAATLDEM